jgi:hypothetical protein
MTPAIGASQNGTRSTRGFHPASISMEQALRVHVERKIHGASVAVRPPDGILDHGFSFLLVDAVRW